jgi:hypothetical protein
MELLLQPDKKVIITDYYFEGKENKDQKDSQINVLMEYVSADLILENKFMLTDLDKGKLINKGLRTKRRKENGNRYLDFLLPDKRPFLTMVLSYRPIIFN